MGEFRQPTAEGKEWVKTKQAEVDEKIRLGILPKGAEVAICLTVGCRHWAHAKNEPYHHSRKIIIDYNCMIC